MLYKAWLLSTSWGPCASRSQAAWAPKSSRSITSLLVAMLPSTTLHNYAILPLNPSLGAIGCHCLMIVPCSVRPCNSQRALFQWSVVGCNLISAASRSELVAALGTHKLSSNLSVRTVQFYFLC